MRVFTSALLLCFSLCCCILELAAALDCSFHDVNGVVSCTLGYRGGGGAKLAVVVSSDVDHSQEALDFINSWHRFPPCSQALHSEHGTGTMAIPVDRELLPALVLRMSCDWGFKKCELVVQDMIKAAEPHMHCFSELISKMNIVMFRQTASGSTVADCLEFGESIFDSEFDEVYPCYNDTLSAAHKANHPHGSFCPRLEQHAVRHLVGADCSFLALPSYLASSGFGGMMYIESDNAVLKPMWLASLLALLASDEHSWIVGSKPLDALQVWDGFTLNGGVALLNLKSNTFLSILDEMQNPESSTCLTTYSDSAESTISRPCLRLRNVASFDLRLAATLRAFMSVPSAHRHEIVRGVVRSSELFRHAPPTVEVLDMRWHQAAFPRCIFIHKLPQMIQEYKTWDLSCSSLPSKSWMSVAGCPVVKPPPSTDSHAQLSDSDVTEQLLRDLPSKLVIDLSASTIHRTDAEWQSLLSPLQYRVTRQQGTEPAFRNLYWDHHEDGVYFSVCSDAPLFDSRDKFDSGSGWPSFTQPISQAFIGETVDTSYGMRRVEVHAVDGAHLGHVFEDGPVATGGRRYCINSASLRFMPREEYNVWFAKRALQTNVESSCDHSLLQLPGNDKIPPPSLPGNMHSIEMPMRYSKWRQQTPSSSNCSLTQDGLLCQYPVRSFAVFMHTCSPATAMRMMSPPPCHFQSNMRSVYTLLLPSFTDCSLSLSDWHLVQSTSCFARSVVVAIPCASTQYACSAKFLLSSRSSGGTEFLPQFDYLIGLPGYMSFCPYWLDQLAFYVTSSSDAIWWLGVSSVAAFPRLFDDFYIFKGGDPWLQELLQQLPLPATVASASSAEQPPSLLYSSITADAAAIANHASSMVRPIPHIERSIEGDDSCDCAIVSACIAAVESSVLK